MRKLLDSRMSYITRSRKKSHWIHVSCIQRYSACIKIF